MKRSRLFLLLSICTPEKKNLHDDSTSSSPISLHPMSITKPHMHQSIVLFNTLLMDSIRLLFLLLDKPVRENMHSLNPENLLPRSWNYGDETTQQVLYILRQVSRRYALQRYLTRSTRIWVTISEARNYAKEGPVFVSLTVIRLLRGWEKKRLVTDTNKFMFHIFENLYGKLHILLPWMTYFRNYFKFH